MPTPGPQPSQPSQITDDAVAAEPRAAVIGRLLGPLLALGVYVVYPESAESLDVDGVATTAGAATAAIAVWMATWWMTEALPIYATALLPLALFPLCGVGSMRETAEPYAHELIFLFMGGFMLALAMQRSGLHRRFALFTLRLAGDRPANMIAGFMVVSALLSMWVSNTATAVMMLPVAVSVLELAEDHAPASWTEASRQRFAVALLLGIAYSASIGGLATPVGSPPNLFVLSFLSAELDRSISFVTWMTLGLPAVAVMLPVTWWLLVRRLFPIPADRLVGGRALFAQELRALGATSRAERIVAGVFAGVCLLWLSKPLLLSIELYGVRWLAGLSDAGIAMTGALALFCAPDGRGARVLDWPTAVRLPWGVLILFGGGLTLAAAIGRNGVDDWIGAQSAALAGLPVLLIVLAVIAGMVFLTELTSNTASTAALVPILAALAPGLGVSPIALVIPAAMAASFAFMLPVATPPNAVIFGSGRVSIRDMMRAGLWLNLLGIVVIGALAFGVVLPILGD